MPEGREQETALALIAQGKGDVWRVEHRHVLEAQHDSAAGAFLEGGVKLDRLRLQHPILIARRASGVAHPRQRDLALLRRCYLAREAASIAIAQLKNRLVEFRAAE